MMVLNRVPQTDEDEILEEPQYIPYEWDDTQDANSFPREFDIPRSYAPPRISEREWLQICPEAKKDIHFLIKEKKESNKQRWIKGVNLLKDARARGENDYAVISAFVEEFIAKPLDEDDRHIKRLQALLHEPTDGIKKFDELKEKAKSVPIVEIAERFVPGIRRIGSKFTARCPFHEDARPSFVLYPSTNSFHCFGCLKSGDTITLFRELNNASFKEAVHQLANV